MQLVYEIVRESDTGLSVYSFKVARRRDSAQRALESAVYDMIAASGLLDRQCGHDVMKQAREANIRAPKRGHVIDRRFRLAGQSVTVLATRVPSAAYREKSLA